MLISLWKFYINNNIKFFIFFPAFIFFKFLSDLEMLKLVRKKVLEKRFFEKKIAEKMNLGKNGRL